MLGSVRLKASFHHEKNCFAYISPKYSTNNDQNQCVQVICREKHLLLWVVYSINVPEGQIACNPIFSQMIGLEEGSEVFVSPYNNAKVLDELYVDADSPDDQEILEHNAELLQLRVLDQLRLVVANQKAIVWISVSLPIVFTPKQTGILVNQSKIIVKVDAFNTFHRPPSIVNHVPKENNCKFNNIGLINDGMLKPYLNSPKKLVLRAVPIDCDGQKNLVHPYTVFLHEDLIDERYKNCSTILATMLSIPSVLREIEEDEDDNKFGLLNNLCVEIVPINNVVFRSLCREVYNKYIPTILIPKSLNTIVNVENGSKLILTMVGDNVEQPDVIDIATYTQDVETESDIIDNFKHCVIENTHSGKKFLINSGVVKQNKLISNGFLLLKLHPERLKYTVLNSESFRECRITAKNYRDTELSALKPALTPIEFDTKNYCRTIKSVEALIHKVVSHLYFEVHRQATFQGVSEIKSNVLITGGSGKGKSSICVIVQRELTVWSHIVQCRALRGRKDLPEVLGKAILMCQEHSPSVLICDDIDSLVPPNMEGASPQDIAYYQRLAVVIKRLLQSCAGVTVLMTATSMKALHPILAQFSGKPLFTAHFDLADLGQAERVELFKYLVNDKIRNEFVVEDEDFARLAMNTEGHSIRDLTDYLNKKIFEAVKKKSDDEKPRLLEATDTDKEKSSVMDVWAPIGGMADIKQELTECIFWPLMYPALFPSKSCGILIYGPPGTGKSYIGSCLAAASQINFIAVKGPELLSKYIGQSEKAVRDVFDKAEMKRPCVLFFDELDSLAPKRGHDSTGVTDRVVTQLLSRLDGAEGGAAGPVLGSSSRPDLLDPALLRAPRLPRRIYCRMPDRKDRYDILKNMSKDVTLSEDVDLEEVAERTDGFSPADLKSLLVTAQLTSLENQLDNIDDNNANMKSVLVSKEDMECSLRETKPSLSKQQLRFYESVYKRFRGENLSDEEKVVSSQFTRQRVTLA